MTNWTGNLPANGAIRMKQTATTLLALLALLFVTPVQAEPSQADIDAIRQTISKLYDQAKAAKDASSDDQVKAYARAIERIADSARTLGVQLDFLVDDDEVDVPDVGPDVPDIDPVDPEPIDPPVNATKIKPGSGWNGPTPTPAQIGDRHERAIAHWNVVTMQTVQDGFTVGVVAHHLDGMDRVKIAANGGEWVTIKDPSINPRTKCEEYWAVLDIGGKDEINLRAIAYPKRGQPVLLEEIRLYTTELGEVVTLKAGKHVIEPRDLPKEGWLTFRPEPGLTASDVTIVCQSLEGGKSRQWTGGRLRFQDVTIQLDSGGSSLRGTPGAGAHIWLDRCNLIGSGPKPKDATWAIVYWWETAAFTDCEITDVRRAFAGAEGIRYLVRNTTVRRIYEDVINAGGLFVNLTVEDADRNIYTAEHPDLEKYEIPHPDLLQVRNMTNTILQDVIATKNFNGQGIFVQGNNGKPGEINGAALVRVNIKAPSPWKVFAPEVPIANLLIKDSDFSGGKSYSKASVLEDERVVIDNTPSLQWSGAGLR